MFYEIISWILQSIWMWPAKEPDDPFALFSLPTELTVLVLRHILLHDFKDFRNSLRAFPELNDLVICLTDCPEAASSVLPGALCVTEHDYIRLMGSPSTKRPLAIMIISPYLPHRGLPIRPLNHVSTLLDPLQRIIRDTLVAKFFSLDKDSQDYYLFQLELTEASFPTQFGLTWLKEFPCKCACPQPTTFPQKGPKLYFPSRHERGGPSDYNGFGRPAVDKFVIKNHTDVENLWIAYCVRFPLCDDFVLPSSRGKNEVLDFPRLKHIHLDVRSYRPAQCLHVSSKFRVWLEAPVLQTATIYFTTPQCPTIRDVILESGTEEYPLTKSTGKELVLRNMNWSTGGPCGKTRGCSYTSLHFGPDAGHVVHDLGPPHDQFYCSVADFEQPGVRTCFMFESYVLIGLPDKFLLYAHWDCVTSLYWKRLEPFYPRGRINPATVHCPSLKCLKIYRRVDDKVALIRFDAPVLEQLVLVSLPDSVEPWDAYALLNYNWPETLTKFTIASYVTTFNITLMKEVLEPHTMLTHLWIHRIDHTPLIKDIRFPRLVYLDLDVTAVQPRVLTPTGMAIMVVLEELHYPSLETLVLSMPQMLNKGANVAIVPISVQLPESCQCLGVATMLSTRWISVNGQILELPPDFTQKPLLEACTRYVKQSGVFVADGEMMASGQSLDMLMELQHSDFDHEKRACN